MAAHLVVILGRGRGHVLEICPHVHVMDGAIGGTRVGVYPHPLHLLYW